MTQEAVDSTRASEPARPFLKWAGGKSQLLEQFEPLLPPLKGRYFEPFVGGAALFFHKRPLRATLSDANEDLVLCYRVVRDRVEELVTRLEQHELDADHFYAVRDQDPRTLDPVERAARFVFLNKTAFNGLYRVNRSGRFNVPFGKYKTPAYRTPRAFRTLRACSLALAGVKLFVRDFAEVLEDAERGDFVYLDPPYVPVSETSDFTSYVMGGFGTLDQQRLAMLFADLARKGVHAMLSNSDTTEVRKLYRGFHIDVVRAARSVNSDGAGRGKVNEVVVRTYT